MYITKKSLIVSDAQQPKILHNFLQNTEKEIKTTFISNRILTDLIYQSRKYTKESGLNPVLVQFFRIFTEKKKYLTKLSEFG